LIKRILLILLLTALPITAQQDRHLDEWYASFNHSYFQDELPANTVITRNLTDDRFMAITEYENGRYHIGINPKYNISSKSERINLLHEMCHIRGFIEHDDEFDQHGLKWQTCMHSLADQKAFEDLW
jgi:hypothetical protein